MTVLVTSIKNTFLEVSEEEPQLAVGSHRRSRSCGDLPEATPDDAAPDSGSWTPSLPRDEAASEISTRDSLPELTLPVYKTVVKNTFLEVASPEPERLRKSRSEGDLQEAQATELFRACPPAVKPDVQQACLQQQALAAFRLLALQQQQLQLLWERQFLMAAASQGARPHTATITPNIPGANSPNAASMSAALASMAVAPMTNLSFQPALIKESAKTVPTSTEAEAEAAVTPVKSRRVRRRLKATLSRADADGASTPEKQSAQPKGKKPKATDAGPLPVGCIQSLPSEPASAQQPMEQEFQRGLPTMLTDFAELRRRSQGSAIRSCSSSSSSSSSDSDSAEESDIRVYRELEARIRRETHQRVAGLPKQGCSVGKIRRQ